MVRVGSVKEMIAAVEDTFALILDALKYLSLKGALSFAMKQIRKYMYFAYQEVYKALEWLVHDAKEL